MKLTNYLDNVIEENANIMSVIEIEQMEDLNRRFPAKQYYTSMGKKELAETILAHSKHSVIRPYHITNYRLDVFFLEDSNEIAYTFFNPDRDPDNDNSHSSLASRITRKLERKGIYIDYEKHFCAFYSLVCGNDTRPTLILYDESDDYKHNEYSSSVLKKFIEEFKRETGYEVINLTTVTL